jgi:CBS domain-containing protein
VHASDGAGVSGEGLQIGEGDINFVELLPVLLGNRPTLIPEIWMGHHNDGRGFRVALEHLTDLTWAVRALERREIDADERALEMLMVSADATVFGALRVIDENRMGIGFVVDAERKVLGVITDGDIRHAFVRGSHLHSPVVEVMTRDFRSATTESSAEDIVGRLLGRTNVLPILDGEGRLVDYASGVRTPTHVAR